ncbi:hypothetical protein [Aminobacter sp. J44]|jgi:hypothetical protein|uniref:hypothetical protein n=1 Tax=Aminobacter sp. J44 TaxID=935262 RepID=UPI00119B7813|nr:hypothetical protein [Aminobacter sp. J44]TWG49777.1 hypothetical protein L610_006900000020 [Aminobacter sp. J44]
MKMSLKLPVAAATWLVLAYAAIAEGAPAGEVKATIDDAPYAGVTLDVPSERTSTAGFRRVGPVTSLTIQAHDPDAKSILRNVLSLEISLMGDDASSSIMEASISWWPEGMRKAFYHSEGSESELNVALDALSLEDGAASVRGSFSALLCRKDSFFAETDMSNCLPVEGTFESALRKAD